VKTVLFSTFAASDAFHLYRYAAAPDAPTDVGAGIEEFGSDWQFFFDCMLAGLSLPGVGLFTLAVINLCFECKITW
jgi:hypothetical protein